MAQPNIFAAVKAFGIVRIHADLTASADEPPAIVALFKSSVLNEIGLSFGQVLSHFEKFGVVHIQPHAIGARRLFHGAGDVYIDFGKVTDVAVRGKSRISRSGNIFSFHAV